MDNIVMLERNSSLHQIVATINALVGSMNSNIDILSTLTSGSIGEKVAFTASNSVFVTGEVYTVTISGLYKIVSEGVGTTRYSIKSGLTGEIVEVSQNQSDDFESDEKFLSEGDKVLFYASSGSNETITIKLIMTGSFFSTVQSLRQQILDLGNRIGQLEDNISSTASQQEELLSRAEEILNNHTNQVALFQQDIQLLSERLLALENA